MATGNVTKSNVSSVRRSTFQTETFNLHLCWFADVEPAMLSWEDAARFMAELSGWRDSNLSLQKKMYIAQMLYMGVHNGERLFDAGFEAWDLGPVIPALYHRAKIYGPDAVQDVFYGADPVTDPRRRAFLEGIAKQLAKWKAPQLVSFTHRDNGAWALNYKPEVRGIAIPDSDIVGEYARFHRRPASANVSGVPESV